MSPQKFSYTRTRGKGRTYEIEITSNSFKISLDGKILKHSVLDGTFDVTEGGVLHLLAQGNIESLDGMTEE